MSNLPTNNLPPHWTDPIVEIFKREMDPTLLAYGLSLTPSERIKDLEEMQALSDKFKAARRLKQENA